MGENLEDENEKTPDEKTDERRSRPMVWVEWERGAIRVSPASRTTFHLLVSLLEEAGLEVHPPSSQLGV